MARNNDTLLRRGELERLSALETLKGLSNPGDVKLAELVGFLESRDLWTQFSKITLGDLRDAFSAQSLEAAAEAVKEDTPRKRKRKIMNEIIGIGIGDTGDADEPGDDTPVLMPKQPADGGISTEEVARNIVPFVEGNGDVTLDDIAEYSDLDRKVLRFHLGVLCKEGRLERIGVGRHAIYSAVG